MLEKTPLIFPFHLLGYLPTLSGFCTLAGFGAGVGVGVGFTGFGAAVVIGSSPLAPYW